MEYMDALIDSGDRIEYTEDGNAETIVYTNGYGAPEIERRLYDEYNQFLFL